MLNPEYVDFEREGAEDIVKIGFSDEDGTQAIEIIISESDGFKLSKMLLYETNLIAKKRRTQVIPTRLLKGGNK